MKCPKCGFVSFPGLDRCKKCGHQFTPVQNREPAIPPLFVDLSKQVAERQGSVSEPREEQDTATGPDTGKGNRSSAPAELSLSPPGQGDPATDASGTGPSADWQKELMERMQEFRRRRARIYDGKEDDEQNLNLDFKASPSGSPKPGKESNLIEFPSFDDLNLQEGDPQGLGQGWDSFGGEEGPESVEREESAGTGAEEIREEPRLSGSPLEIEMDSSPAASGVLGSAGEPPELFIAPMSRRFFAGLFDLLVLLSAGGVFALIFWKAAGRVPLSPLNLAVAALIGVIFLLAYFGVFTVFADGTPGLIWAGLEVRTFEGNRPKRMDCFWRSFGYLVSISALLLGFIWALVDADGLTWHDRMSRTLLVEAQDVEAVQAAASAST